MSDLHVKYLLVGGGLAAYSAAVAIRQQDARGSILLIGRESSRPYYRTPLSKSFLRRQHGRAELFTCEPDWFAGHGVQLRTGCHAAHLDTSRAIVVLDSGDSITYDRLLLATGALPRPLDLPGAQLPNLFSLRTIDDAEQIQKAIDKARHEGRRHEGGRGRAVVIGGGLLGVEISSVIAQAGIAVQLITGGAHPWAKFAGETTGKFLSHYLSARGVTVHDGVRAIRVEGDGRAQRVVLSDGTVQDCDFAVAAVGTAPTKDLLRGTGIVAEKAILADEHCRTNVPNIYAAGDCAAVRDPIFGKHRTAEQWDTAAQTGAIAGANMSGGNASFAAVTSFTTSFFDLTARAWGHSKHLSRRLLRGTPNLESPNFLEIGVGDDQRISHILAVGPAIDEPLLEELVRQRAAITGNEETLKDPTANLASMLGS